MTEKKELNNEELKNASGGASQGAGWYCPFCGSLIAKHIGDYRTNYFADRLYGHCPGCDSKITIRFNIGLLAHTQNGYMKCEYHSS